MRRIRKNCAVCHKEILGNEYELESDIRGVVKHIYHKSCVIVREKAGV